MLTTRPYPDELALGHKHRVLALDPNLTEVIDDRSQQLADCVTHLGGIAGLSRDTYIREHTLLPFLRAIRSERNPTTFSTSPDGDVMALQGGLTKLTTTAVCYCTKCCAEDQSFWGLSYWRRTHQIPGLDYCPKHLNSLRRIKSRTLPATQPHECHDNGNATASTQSLPVRTYVEIAFALLEMTTPLAREVVRERLTMRAWQLGLVIKADRRLKGPYVSDLAMERFPQEWLQTHFPTLVKKKLGAPAILDFLVTQHGVWGTGDRYALALATMFDAPADAMACLLGLDRAHSTAAATLPTT